VQEPGFEVKTPFIPYELVVKTYKAELIVLMIVLLTASTGTMHALVCPQALPPASNFQIPVGTVITLQTPEKLSLMLNPMVFVDL
jgi:hypothetical protein